MLSFVMLLRRFLVYSLPIFVLISSIFIFFAHFLVFGRTAPSQNTMFVRERGYMTGQQGIIPALPWPAQRNDFEQYHDIA